MKRTAQRHSPNLLALLPILMVRSIGPWSVALHADVPAKQPVTTPAVEQAEQPSEEPAGREAKESNYEPGPAVQRIYRDGVPHTDRRGRRMAVYDPERSFFMIGSWGVPESREYKGVDYGWDHLVQAGYNTVWPWAMGEYTSEAQLAHGQQFGMQVILMRRPGAEALAKLKDHPNLMGIVWQDEPLVHFGIDNQGGPLEEFQNYKKMANQVAPDLPIFVNTTSWMTGKGRPWFTKWNQVGDISSHDNYPIWPVTQSINLGSYGTAKNGIADSVSMAVRVNDQKKPIWLLVPAFESLEAPTTRFPFRFATPVQLRAMVYAGVIHGATGIAYYAWDSNITRFGYAPSRQEEIPGRPSATPMQAIQAEALWHAASQINHELIELSPVILAATAGPDVEYHVTFQRDAITATPLRTLLKPHPDGGYVLLTVNLDNAVLSGKLTFNRPLSSVQPLYENRPVLEDVKGKKSFSRDYEPFDVHLYRLEFE